MMWLDKLLMAGHKSILECRFKFSNVTWPGVVEQYFDGVFTDNFDGFAIFQYQIFEKCLC